MLNDVDAMTARARTASSPVAVAAQVSRYAFRHLMLTAISRYGARVLPDTEQIVAGCKARGEFIQGPADRPSSKRASRGRAGDRPRHRRLVRPHGLLLHAEGARPAAGSEIVLPALTFWVVPELARVAGLKVVFADVDPNTFTIDPAALERAITPATRAVVPTHLYGLPCDMDAIMAIAARHNLMVIEDCAHALGATLQGPAGRHVRRRRASSAFRR